MQPPIVEGVPMPSVQRFLDAEKGKPCWIIGGGPSLLKQDPREMDGVQIVVNFSIWAHERLGFPEADYWMFGDTAIFWRPGFEVINPDDYPRPRKFVAGPPLYYLLGKGYEPSLDGRGKTFVPFYNNNDFIICRQADYLWSQWSMLCSCVSLAWVLGCNPIHIRGCDFGTKHGDGRSHWYDPPGVTADQKHINYERMKRPIRTLVNAIRMQSNVEFTAGGDISILEPEAVK
jgi:hypothetical protein